MTYKTIQAECGSCGGTGLYEGFAEKKGEPVICLECKGTGAVSLKYKEYTGRKKMYGIKSVSMSRGAFIATGVGARPGTTMTYAEFQQKIPEAEIER